MFCEVLAYVLNGVANLNDLAIIFGISTGAILLIVVGVLLYTFIFKKKINNKKKHSENNSKE